MSWVAYGLATVVLWAFWGLLGKVALRTVGWVQASLFFGGVAALAIYGVLLAARPREATWSLTDLLVPLATGFVGALGLASFYIALERDRGLRRNGDITVGCRFGPGVAGHTGPPLDLGCL